MSHTKTQNPDLEAKRVEEVLESYAEEIYNLRLAGLAFHEIARVLRKKIPFPSLTAKEVTGVFLRRLNEMDVLPKEKRLEELKLLEHQRLEEITRKLFSLMNHMEESGSDLRGANAIVNISRALVDVSHRRMELWGLNSPEKSGDNKSYEYILQIVSKPKEGGQTDGTD